MRQPGRLKHIARLGALITLLATMLVLATTSSAQAEEQIDSFNAEVVVRPNGDLDVRETIAWDFGGASNKHGIFRFVPRLHLWTLDQRPGWKSWQKFYRLTPITFLDASSPTGANTDQFVERKGSNEVLRLGRKNREVFGLQTYNIHYVVGRAVVNNELRYAVTGRGWVVSARSIRAHISVAIAARGRPR